jgi:aspartate racemase
MQDRARPIGILACSFEGAALCYRTIGLDAEAFMGPGNHPRITLDNIPMAQMLPYFERGDYAGLGALMAQSAARLEAAGAAILICPDNSCHLAYEHVTAACTGPFLHIPEVVSRTAQKSGFKKAAILGTAYTMQSTLYRNALHRVGIEAVSPRPEQQQAVNAIIFDELVKGTVTPRACADVLAIVTEMKAAGCDSVVLGCTELPMIADAVDIPLPCLDSTRLLARAALLEALSRGGHDEFASAG